MTLRPNPAHRDQVRTGVRLIQMSEAQHISHGPILPMEQPTWWQRLTGRNGR